MWHTEQPSLAVAEGYIGHRADMACTGWVGKVCTEVSVGLVVVGGMADTALDIVAADNMVMSVVVVVVVAAQMVAVEDRVEHCSLVASLVVLLHTQYHHLPSPLHHSNTPINLAECIQIHHRFHFPHPHHRPRTHLGEVAVPDGVVLLGLDALVLAASYI